MSTFAILVIFALGYLACILVPCPWLSRKVLDGWARLWARIKAA